MYDTPNEHHSNLSHDLPPGTGNIPDPDEAAILDGTSPIYA